jgi:hypothetical protein
MTSPSFNAADELLLFEVAGLEITLAADAQHIEVVGPDDVVAAAWPKLKQHRAALLIELQCRVAGGAAISARRSA